MDLKALENQVAVAAAISKGWIGVYLAEVIDDWDASSP